MAGNRAWTDLPADDLHNLLVSLVGYDFGARPEQRIDEIRASRVRYTRRFIRLAGITRQDSVLELGSGCGFGTRAIAERARVVYGCDISPAYLDYARRECGDVPNIEWVNISRLDFSNFHARFGTTPCVDKVLAISVFIHFNLYDIYCHFQLLSNIVKMNGKVCFDFANMDGLFSPAWRLSRRTRLDNQRFIEHAGYYQRDPVRLPALMQWNSPRGIRRVAAHAGYRLLRRSGPRLVFRRLR